MVPINGLTPWTHQLTAVDHSYQTDESYSYDAMGNRTNSGYSTGTANRLTSDGVYNYTYDDEGNRLYSESWRNARDLAFVSESAVIYNNG